MSALKTRSSPSKCTITHRSQRGIGLVDAMVSSTILAIGLLGALSLHMSSIKGVSEAAARESAYQQATSILDAMRANPTAAIGGQYETGGFICSAPSGGSLAKSDVAFWMKQLRSEDSFLKNACGQISCARDDCTVKIRWDKDGQPALKDGVSMRAYL